MKRIKDLREQYDLITEKEEAETKKLAALVRAGLFDAKKMTSLKRALEKPVDKMTAQEKRMLINLLDSLMSEVLNNKTVYQKVKQDVMKEAVTVDTKDYLTKIDPRVKRYGYSQKDAPSVLLLKRKAIRVFPDGEKVALYYAQAIDKYVSIPFSEIGINESVLGDIVRGIVRNVVGGDDEESSKKDDSVAKELKPLEREKIKLNVSSDLKDKPYTTGVEARRQKYERDANMAMAKSVRESFKNKLHALNEFAPDPRIMDPIERIKKLKKQERIDKKNQRTRPLPKDRKADLPKEEPKIPPKEETKTSPKDTVKDGLKSYIAKQAVRLAPKVLGPVGALVGMTEPAGSKQEREWELSNVKRRQAEKSSKAQNWPGKGTTGLGDIRPKTKVATPPDRPIGTLPKAKADSKGTSAFTGMPTKSAPKAKLPSAPKNPNVGITSISKPDDGSESEIAKRLKSDKLASAKSGSTTDADVKTPEKIDHSTKTALQPATGQPWKGSDSWKEPAKNKKKNIPDEEGTGRREPKETKPPKKPFKLPGLAISDPGAKALTSLTPGLKLAISGPRREGDADAVRSRMAAYERKAWQSQANMKESVEINLDGNQFVLNNKEANKVLSLYESLNAKNKKKMVKMMNESEEQFNKIVSFAVRQ